MASVYQRGWNEDKKFFFAGIGGDGGGNEPMRGRVVREMTSAGRGAFCVPCSSPDPSSESSYSVQMVV